MSISLWLCRLSSLGNDCICHLFHYLGSLCVFLTRTNCGFVSNDCCFWEANVEVSRGMMVLLCQETLAGEDTGCDFNTQDCCLQIIFSQMSLQDFFKYDHKHSLTLSKAATPYLIWSVMICSNQRLLLLLTSTTQNGQKTNKLHRYEHLILKHMFKIRLCVLHSDWLKLITYWLEFNKTFDLTRDASFVSLNHQRSRSLKQKKRGKPFQKTPFVHHWLTLNHEIKEPYDVVAGS